ncbi:hypothetical protein [Mesorhizobium australicum]|uniref:hypothetical protein n=1 Tax=Mesorhizobium australicum TaxID=536018 RepID=UPI00333770C8
MDKERLHPVKRIASGELRDLYRDWIKGRRNSTFQPQKSMEISDWNTEASQSATQYELQAAIEEEMQWQCVTLILSRKPSTNVS